MQRCLVPTTCANLKLTKSTSYSASLLYVLNPNHIGYSILRHSSLDELRTRPAPHLLSFKDPSTYKSYVGAERVVIVDFSATELESGDTSPFSLGVSLAMKFATT